MKKTRSDSCHCSSETVEDILHIILYCDAYDDIRTKFLSNLTLQNPKLLSFSQKPQIIILAILDPESPKLPEEIRFGWKSSHVTYKLTRDFLYNIHRKRTKITEENADNE